jgi:hypothetical protein
MKHSITGLGVIALGLCLFVNSQEKQDRYIIHHIKKGESISLICIDYYGHYSPAMGIAIKKSNTSISDINLITAGRTLKLVNPKKPDTPEPAQTMDSVTNLFEQKVALTQGVVTCLEGSVSIYAKDAPKKIPLQVNSQVFPGDMIETGKYGRVEIIINRESVVRIGENTRMRFDAYRDVAANKGKTNVSAIVGALWVKVKRFSDKLNRFELSLPNAVAGVHGTVYETKVLADSSSEVKVYNGEVAVKNAPVTPVVPTGGALQEVGGPSEVAGPHEVSMEEWTRIIRAMQKITIDKKGNPSEVASFKQVAAGSWEQWNQERDARIAEMFSEKE